jgi:DMSO reductase anchor subunit
MHPALSIILFTTLSGAAWGQLAWLGLLESMGLLPDDRGFALVAGLLGVGIAVAGLVCSTFHLRHPERAWRALSQWRTSWLSREGVLALASLASAVVFFGDWLAWGAGEVAVAAGLVTALLALGTIVCTAMIYRSLWTVPAWHNSWTVPVFLLIGLASGALLLCASVALATGMLSPVASLVGLVALVAAAAVKAGAWRAQDRATAFSSAASAVGLAGRVNALRPVQPPSSSATYLQKEMGFRIARKHAAKLRRVAGILGVALPLLALALTSASGVGGVLDVVLALVAVGSGLAGALVERWLFFAEARHKVTLYDGAVRV